MLKGFIFLGLVAYASAIVCPQNICQTVRCAAVDATNCAGTVKSYGGFCGCCDACINELGVGDKCLPNFLLGVPQTSQCGANMFCDPKSNTCMNLPIIVRDTAAASGPCAKKLAEVNARLAASNHMLLGLEKPKCDPTTGDYLGMQFAGSQAYCVTKDGTSISGYMVNRWETGKMNCNCARDQYAYQQTGLIGKMFHCEANGNYASMGCTGSVCYCQDENGQQIGTSTVNIGQMGSLNC